MKPAEVLRKLDAKGDRSPWRVLFSTNVVADSADANNVNVLSASSNMHSDWERLNAENAELIVTIRNVLPLLADVLDAADAMYEQHPHATRPFDHDVFGIAAYRVAVRALLAAMEKESASG